MYGARAFHAKIPNFLLYIIHIHIRFCKNVILTVCSILILSSLLWLDTVVRKMDEFDNNICKNNTNLYF